MEKARFLMPVGMVLMVIAGYPLFIAYAFANMMPPEIEGWEYWWNLIDRMYNFESRDGYYVTVASLVFFGGAGLVIWGLYAAIAERIRWF